MSSINTFFNIVYVVNHFTNSLACKSYLHKPGTYIQHAIGLYITSVGQNMHCAVFWCDFHQIRDGFSKSIGFSWWFLAWYWNFAGSNQQTMLICHCLRGFKVSRSGIVQDVVWENLMMTHNQKWWKCLWTVLCFQCTVHPANCDNLIILELYSCFSWLTLDIIWSTINTSVTCATVLLCR